MKRPERDSLLVDVAATVMVLVLAWVIAHYFIRN